MLDLVEQPVDVVRMTAWQALLGTLSRRDGARGLPAWAESWVCALETYVGARPVEVVPVAPHEVADVVVEPQHRMWLIDAMVVGLVVDGLLTEDDAEVIASYEMVFELDDHRSAMLRHIARGQWMRVRFRLIPRMWMMEHLSAQIHERGFFRRIVPFVLASMLGLWTDAATRDRYAALRALPDGSLGRAMIAYFEANQFPLYGERGAIDELIVRHDLSHVLAGYGTFPAHEILAAWYMAGCRGGDITLMLFVLYQFHLGQRFVWVAPPCRGLFRADTALEAFVRGLRTREDVTRTWSHWPHVDQPLEAVRAQLGIAPSRLLPQDGHLHPERGSV